MYPSITFKELGGWSIICITDWGNKKYECEISNTGRHCFNYLMTAVTEILEDERHSSGVGFDMEAEGSLYWLFIPLRTVNRSSYGELNMLKLSIYNATDWYGYEDDDYNELPPPVPEIEFFIGNRLSFAYQLIAEFEKHGIEAFDAFDNSQWQLHLDKLKLAYEKAKQRKQHP